MAVVDQKSKHRNEEETGEGRIEVGCSNPNDEKVFLRADGARKVVASHDAAAHQPLPCQSLVFSLDWAEEFVVKCEIVHDCNKWDLNADY
jgi:hypothetical protein